MTSPIQPRGEPPTASLYHAASGSAFSAFGAIGLVLASMATLIVTGVAVSVAGVDMVLAVGVGQLGLVAIPLIAMRVTSRKPSALGIRRPAPRFVAAAVLVGTSAWYLNMLVVSLLPYEGREPKIDVERSSLPVVLLAIALAPAVCEEIVFRGVLLRGLASRFRGGIAIVMSAVMFSLYHLNPIQMIPTFTLGLVFGLIALRSGTAIPTMVAHTLNNAIALVVVRGELPWLADKDGHGWLARHPTLAMVGAATATASGLALALIGPRPARGAR